MPNCLLQLITKKLKLQFDGTIETVVLGEPADVIRAVVQAFHLESRVFIIPDLSVLKVNVETARACDDSSARTVLNYLDFVGPACLEDSIPIAEPFFYPKGESPAEFVIVCSYIIS